ncbi:MAG: LuxR C-terminal-related transcriptional regulator, partial [Thermomicrobiales bacterium]
NVRSAPDRPTLESVIAALHGQRLLLVLDNLEHLAGPELQELIAQLVQQCPHVTLLATSREPLHLASERCIAVAPMPAPAPGAEAAAIRQLDAVRLFVARAQAVAPAFSPEPADMVAIGEICRRGDGLPLAIELAAAWVRVLSPTALLAQMSERLPLLTGGPADQPARHRAMRDAIAWSYDRLPPEEALLLRALAVFRGGFSLEGAASLANAVGASRQRPPLQLVAALCDKHLLFRTEAIGATQRFAMLETVREFAFEQLVAAGGVAEAQAAHAAFYRTLADRAEQELLGPREAYWFDIYAEDASNLREAIAWGMANDPDTALSLLAALWIYWALRHLPEGRTLLTQALALPDASSPRQRLRALRTAASLALLAADFAASDALTRQGMALLPGVDDRWLHGEITWMYALSGMFTGQVEESRRAFDATLALMEAPVTDTERTNRAYALANSAVLDLIMGDHARCQAAYHQAAAELRLAGGMSVPIIVLAAYAMWHLQAGQSDAARDLLNEALRLARDSRVAWLAALPLIGVSLVDAREGHALRAARRLGAIAALIARTGMVIPANFQDQIDQARDLATEQLGVSAFTHDWERGRRDPLPVLDAVFTMSGVAGAGAGMSNDLAASGITRREHDVLELIIVGRTDREIAEQLFISERTVSKHVSAILQKLDAVSRAEAAARAVRLGLA